MAIITKEGTSPLSYVRPSSFLELLATTRQRLARSVLQLYAATFSGPLYSLRADDTSCEYGEQDVTHISRVGLGRGKIGALFEKSAASETVAFIQFFSPSTESTLLCFRSVGLIDNL